MATEEPLATFGVEEEAKGEEGWKRKGAVKVKKQVKLDVPAWMRADTPFKEKLNGAWKIDVKWNYTRRPVTINNGNVTFCDKKAKITYQGNEATISSFGDETFGNQKFVLQKVITSYGGQQKVLGVFQRQGEGPIELIMWRVDSPQVSRKVEKGKKEAEKDFYEKLQSRMAPARQDMLDVRPVMWDASMTDGQPRAGVLHSVPLYEKPEDTCIEKTLYYGCLPCMLLPRGISAACTGVAKCCNLVPGADTKYDRRDVASYVYVYRNRLEVNFPIPEITNSTHRVDYCLPKFMLGPRVWTYKDTAQVIYFDQFAHIEPFVPEICNACGCCLPFSQGPESVSLQTRMYSKTCCGMGAKVDGAKRLTRYRIKDLGVGSAWVLKRSIEQAKTDLAAELGMNAEELCQAAL